MTQNLSFLQDINFDSLLEFHSQKDSKTIKRLLRSCFNTLNAL